MEGQRIAVVGLWHLGSVYAASLAKLGFHVTGFDFNKAVIDDFKKGIPPIFEPGLEETIKAYSDNLEYSTSEKSLQNKDYIFITYDLEVDNDDIPQMQIVDRIFTLLQKNANPESTIVISSQIPVGTSRNLINALKTAGNKKPKVIYFPENLRLGNGFATFLTPDRIILGSDDRAVMDQFEKDFTFPCPIITMGLESAEMVKHALNTYLATCISLSSELSDLAEKVGANMTDVVKAMKLDKRVSPSAPLNPGLGFAGGTLGRDIQSLRKIARDLTYEPKMLNAIHQVNRDRLPMLVSKIRSILPTLKGKTVGILGLTYKPNTDTLRRSMSLELASLLHAEGCKIKAYDPAIQTKAEGYEYIDVTKTVGSFAKDADVMILMTDWPEFQYIDPGMFSSKVVQKIIIDTKNFLDPKLYKKHGFRYLGIGTE